eukprot:3457936-Amphidinium_carterae.2
MIAQFTVVPRLRSSPLGKPSLGDNGPPHTTKHVSTQTGPSTCYTLNQSLRLHPTSSNFQSIFKRTNEVCHQIHNMLSARSYGSLPVWKNKLATETTRTRMNEARGSAATGIHSRTL